MSFWASLTLGLIAAVVGTYFQIQLWKQKRREEIREYELKDIQATIESISKLYGTRIHAQREFHRAVVEKRCSTEVFNDARESVSDWITNFYFLRSQLKRYFGTEVSYPFEYEVHATLKKTYDATRLAYDYDYSNLSKLHKHEFEAVPERLLISAKEFSRFMSEVSDRIDTDDFGTQKFRNNINIGKLDMIDYFFLFKNLFNVRG